MTFDFEKFKSTLYKSAVAAKDTSLTLVEIAKCKMKIVELKSEVENKYIEIGKLVYNKNDEIETKDLIETLCNEITNLKNSIEDIQNIIDENFNRKKCSECNRFFDKDFDFCPKCGKAF